MAMSGIVWIIVAALFSLGYVAVNTCHRWLRFKEKMLGDAARHAATEAARHVACIERLEQRTMVLERIVTDKHIETSMQVDKLRNAPLN
jgi:hypothetical protein